MAVAKNILRKHKEPPQRLDVTLDSEKALFFGRIATKNSMRTGELLKQIILYVHSKQDSAFFKKMIEDITD